MTGASISPESIPNVNVKPEEGKIVVVKEHVAVFTIADTVDVQSVAVSLATKSVRLFPFIPT